MSTPEKDGAPQAWADERASRVVEAWDLDPFVEDGCCALPQRAVFHLEKHIGRALQATREKALREAATLCSEEGLGAVINATHKAKEILGLIDQEPKK